MIELVLTLAVVGFIVYLITTFIPMPAIFKTVIYGVVALAVILYLLKMVGVGDMAVPQL